MAPSWTFRQQQSRRYAHFYRSAATKWVSSVSEEFRHGDEWVMNHDCSLKTSKERRFAYCWLFLQKNSQRFHCKGAMWFKSTLWRLAWLGGRGSPSRIVIFLPVESISCQSKGMHFFKWMVTTLWNKQSIVTMHMLNMFLMNILILLLNKIC